MRLSAILMFVYILNDHISSKKIETIDLIECKFGNSLTTSMVRRKHIKNLRIKMRKNDMVFDLLFSYLYLIFILDKYYKL